MLRIHFSNRLETLSARLVSALRQPTASAQALWQACPVVVPSAGMQRRLTLDLADGLGICTQVQFSYLAQWLWSLMARHLTGVAQRSPLEVGPLSWRIDALFQDAQWVNGYPRLASYLKAADDLMRFQLAEQVARLLETYATFRPDWGACWRHGETVLDATSDPLGDEGWQSSLWQQLSADLGLDDHHPAQAFVRWLTQMYQIGQRPPGLPERVHVVALPSMPPLHLQVLQALGMGCDVEIYALNPCQEYWFDVVDPRRLAWLATRPVKQRPAHRSMHPSASTWAHLDVGHPLLAGWGQQAQAHLSALVQACGDEVLDDAEFTDPAGHCERPSLLAQLQSSILRLETPSSQSFQHSPDDRSLEIHVCHSMVRELEVLHDRLLDILSSPQPPALSEVAVMVPDLAAAAPWIDAVFGAAPPERHIPYTVTGLGRSQVNPYAQLLLEVLSFLPSRWTVSALVALAQREPVSRHFGWSAQDHDLIRSWMEETGTHWGFDEAHRGQLRLPATSRHTVCDGMEQLFLGFALPQDSAHGLSDSGPWPAGRVEGSQAKTLGSWWTFVDALSQAREAVSNPLSGAQWPQVLQDILSRMCHADDTDVENWREVQQALDGLQSELEAASWSAQGVAQVPPWPLDVIRYRLQQWLDEPSRGGVPQGTVTFSSLSSLRNLPFQVVCILGLNDGAFPIHAPTAEFDLLTRSVQPGDRQRRIDERNLFLDTLLSARQTLHLSYTGRHIRDNAEMPPSVLVSELIEFLEGALAPSDDKAARQAVRAQLRVEHPLQAFSETAFGDPHADPRIQSFRADFAQALQARDMLRQAGHGAAGTADTDLSHLASQSVPFVGRPLPVLPADRRRVTLDDLAAFYRYPARYFLEQRLGLQLPRAHSDLEDDEPMTPDRQLPQRWAHRLLQRHRPNDLLAASVEQVKAWAWTEPTTPAGPIGDRAFLQEWQGLRTFFERVAEVQGQPLLPRQHLEWLHDIQGHPWTLQASWEDLRAMGLVRWRYATLGVADHLQAWWHHLGLCAARPPGAALCTRWIGRDGGFEFSPCDGADDLLRQALEGFDQGLRAPLPFFPKTAWAYAQGGYKTSDARKEWEPSSHHRFAESQDLALQWAWRGHDDPLVSHWNDFDDLARSVLDPLLAHLHPFSLTTPQGLHESAKV